MAKGRRPVVWTPYTSNLQELREAAGLTQDQLGQRCGVRRSIISRYERGAGRPPAVMLAKLAEALGKPVRVRPRHQKASAPVLPPVMDGLHMLMAPVRTFCRDGRNFVVYEVTVDADLVLDQLTTP